MIRSIPLYLRKPSLRVAASEASRIDRRADQAWLVAGRLAYERSSERVCHETIYRFASRQSRAIMDRLINVFGPLPHAARSYITFDRGTEFTD